MTNPLGMTTAHVGYFVPVGAPDHFRSAHLLPPYTASMALFCWWQALLIYSYKSLVNFLKCTLLYVPIFHSHMQCLTAHFHPDHRVGLSPQERAILRGQVAMIL